jgi:hypothetical protein
MTTMRIETPLEPMDAPVIDGKKLALVSILRAGNGLLDGILDLIPNARVGFVGLYRDPETLQPVQYYFKVPSELEDRLTIVVDPMLATGNSSAAAIDLLKGGGEEHPFPLPSGRARRGGADETGASRRAHRDRRARQPPQRSRLYRAGSGRCGRPDVRDEVTARGGLYLIGDPSVRLRRSNLGGFACDHRPDEPGRAGGRDDAGFRGHAPAMAQLAMPAEQPPADFRRDGICRQRGLRLCPDRCGRPVEWVPRVGQDRQQLCGMEPSDHPAPTPEPMPEPVIEAAMPAARAAPVAPPAHRPCGPRRPPAAAAARGHGRAGATGPGAGPPARHGPART